MKYNKRCCVAIYILIVFICISMPVKAEAVQLGKTGTDNAKQKVVAIVNGYVITESELEMREKLYFAFNQEIDKQAILDKLIEEKAVITQAKEVGVEPSQIDVERQFRETYEFFSREESLYDNYGEMFDRLNMSFAEYCAQYEKNFTYYRLCLDNLTKELYRQAEVLGQDKFEYSKRQRMQWKENLTVYLIDSAYELDLKKEVFDWNDVKKIYDNNRRQAKVAPLSDEPVGTSFSGTVRKNLYAITADYGAKIFPVSLYIAGRSYNSSGYRWLGPTDIVLYRESELAHEIESLLDDCALTKVNIYRNGALIGDYKTSFSNGCNNSYILPYRMLLGRGSYGCRIGNTGSYSVTVYTVVHIDTMWYEVALSSISMP